MFAYRCLRSFTRGAVEVRCHQWHLIQYEGRSIVGRVSEIVELHVPNAASSVLRMWMLQSRYVDFEDETRGQVVTISRDSSAHEQYVRVECASVLEVHCDEYVMRAA